MQDNTLHTILKYPLRIYDTPGRRVLEIDCISAIPLSVAEQHGDLTLWALVEVGYGGKGHQTHVIDVEIYSTGHPIILEDLSSKNFISTVVMQSTPFVWHVYASEGVARAI